MAIALSGSLILSGSIIVSGSITSTGTVIMSGSIASASYALNATTGAYANTSTSASYALNATTFNGLASSIFATTGSNTFIGNQVVSGSLTTSGSITATGTITAQTLVIQTITSSTVYSSGSNIFGNAIGNTQTFTGSVLITGSVGIGTTIPLYPLHISYTTSTCANNTLSGSIANIYNFYIRQKGASAGISGVQYMTQVFNDPSSNGLEIYTQGASSTLSLGVNATESMRITGSSIGIYTTTPTEKLEINVGAGARAGMAISGEYAYLTFNNSGSSSANARNFALSLTSLEAGDFALKMSNNKGTSPITDGFDPFRISRGGDATITCSLTIAGCGLIMSGTGALTLPNGTTAQRPGTPTTGMIRYNNATNTTEYYNGCGWYAFSDNYVHGVDMLMVSAGGGGGVNLSGAGGGGGVLYFTNFSLRPGIPITIIVGGGGAVGGQGNASCAFGNILCGGQGASQVTFHRSGNSGFLASLANSNCYTSVSVYCNNLGGYASGNAGAGGAGAGAGGCNMSGNSDVSNKATPGGNGIQVGTILDGINNYYWAGGGGGEGYGDYAGAGGCGGGGGGGSFAAYGTSLYPGCGGLGGLNPGCPGTVTGNALNGGAGGVNTGGGGGGGSHTGAGCTATAGGAGGSGIVILRYPQNYNPPIVTGTTPCICTYCGYRSYIFLSSGTITF